MGVRTNAKRGRRGFTLLELLIVIGVIAILASIAMPSYNTARKSANEASAIESMRTIVSAQETYRLRSSSGYGVLRDLKDAGILRPDLGTGSKRGYTFVMTPLPGDHRSYVCIGMPQGNEGDRWFYVDTSGVIRYREGDVPDISSPPLN